MPGRLEAAHVLLVEDDPDALEFLALILRQTGAQVSAFGLAEPAFRFQVECDSRADIIVSDIAMPLQDGHGLMRALRTWERDHDRVPIPAIAVSAFGRDEDLRRSIASGFDRHLAKPIDANVLIDEIGRWIPVFQ
jgi:CheY-like chemotaxis protein